MNEKASMQMEITDMLGRVKVCKETGEITPGNNAFCISTSELPNGVYTIRLSVESKNGENSYLYKVVISK
jgi:hypothetical protein